MIRRRLLIAKVCLIVVGGCVASGEFSASALGAPAGFEFPPIHENRVDAFPRMTAPASQSAPIPAPSVTEFSTESAVPTALPPVGVERPVVVAQPVIVSPLESLKRADTAFRSAENAEAQQSPGCIDLYYFAAEQAYAYLAATNSIQASDGNSIRAWQIYNTALPRMLVNAQRYGRFDALRGMVVNSPRGPGSISFAYRGFVWQQSDFNRLVPADDGQPRELVVNIRANGVGVPMVAIRQRPQPEGFHNKSVPFAVTAILRPTLAAAPPTAPNTIPVANSLPNFATLEFIDPVRVDRAEFAGREVRITRDFTAPFHYAKKDIPRRNVTSFLRPDTVIVDGLYMAEPYQPGKIPLIFVHGLASDRMTWLDLANALRADPLALNQYQFWSYQYSTGKPFLGAATHLREQLREIVDRFDPERQDPAMQQMIVVAHSMGGLVTKLQVTYSGTILWDEIACRPFDQVKGDQATLDDLKATFFFEPVESVKRVVFIGTPFGGSSWASRSVGRLASGLVVDTPSLRKEHRQLIKGNPGVFAPYLQRKVPTSIDLMEPQSPMLAGMRRLSFNRQVKIHTIFGDGGTLTWDEPSDGAVTVASARHPGAESEKLLHVRHEDLHRTSDSVAEILRILREHYQSATLPQPPIQMRSR
jgi:pimeloyl-ACP methyl ester carboxylesterase